ncbi:MULTISPECIES: hypothetical protein [Bacteroidaceae]|jgi:hypothetical protein|uniref:DUF5018-related domain-containing protein n=1 Tax=Bacteroidaceae TaxID=815 RepID=UPI0025881922|nr:MULTISPECIES: hypothetical protein [Bacteroidaceae]
MKKITFSTLRWVLLLVCLPLVSACDWEDLPAYEEAEISAVQLYYRWASDEKDPITQEPIVKEQRLNVSSDVNSDAGVIQLTVTVPDAGGDFTEAVRAEVSTNPLWGQVTVSTAARITPIDGTAALGTPDDWSGERKFSVRAADGNTKIWTIKIVQFNK